jgi:predicted small secreted protein
MKIPVLMSLMSLALAACGGDAGAGADPATAAARAEPASAAATSRGDDAL